MNKKILTFVFTGFLLLFLGSGCNYKSLKNVISFSENTSSALKVNLEKEVDHQKITSSSNDSVTTSKEGDKVSTDFNPIIAYLVMVKDAKVKITRGNETVDGVPDMELYIGDEVEVTSGEVRLLYPDTGLSVLTNGAKVILSVNDDVENTGDSLKTRIILEAGNVWTRLERLLGTNENFEVEAGDLVATVRGTAFAVENNNGDVSVIVADHKVAVFKKGVKKDKRARIVLASGYKVMVSKDSLDGSAGQLRRQMLRRIRRVSSKEKNKTLYRFVKRPLVLDRLKRPDQPFRWTAPIDANKIKGTINPKLLDRLKSLKDKQFNDRPSLLDKEKELRLLKLKSTYFRLPVRTILQSELEPMNLKPQVSGPQIQQ